MTTEEVKQLVTGLYIVNWKVGGLSIAAVGVGRDGKHWCAPTNWISVSDEFDWNRVESVKLLTTQKETIDRQTYDKYVQGRLAELCGDLGVPKRVLMGSSATPTEYDNGLPLPGTSYTATIIDDPVKPLIDMGVECIYGGNCTTESGMCCKRCGRSARDIAVARYSNTPSWYDQQIALKKAGKPYECRSVNLKDLSDPLLPEERKATYATAEARANYYPGVKFTETSLACIEGDKCVVREGKTRCCKCGVTVKSMDDLVMDACRKRLRMWADISMAVDSNPGPNPKPRKPKYTESELDQMEEFLRRTVAENDDPQPDVIR